MVWYVTSYREGEFWGVSTLYGDLESNHDMTRFSILAQLVENEEKETRKIELYDAECCTVSKGVSSKLSSRF